MKEKRKLLLISVVVVLVLALTAIMGNYLYENNYYVVTNNAQVTSDFIKVTTTGSGKLLEFNVKEGDYVVKDQLIGRLDSASASNIRAPISGRIIYKNANVGDYESSTLAPTLALIMDPTKIYVTANVEETVLSKIKIGQSVDITVDQFKGKKLIGKVNSIQSKAENQNGVSTTKVVQWEKVKIEFNNIDTKLLPGSNASIKIHIK